MYWRTQSDWEWDASTKLFEGLISNRESSYGEELFIQRFFFYIMHKQRLSTSAKKSK